MSFLLYIGMNFFGNVAVTSPKLDQQRDSIGQRVHELIHGGAAVGQEEHLNPDHAQRNKILLREVDGVNS